MHRAVPIPVLKRWLPSRLAVLLVLAALVGTTWRPAPLAARAGGAGPLDLAAMVLTPSDLAGAGQAGFGVSSGRWLSVDALADRAVWPAGEGEEFAGVRDALVAAGWGQGYAAVLTTIRDYDDPGPIRDVEVEVVAYADATGAAAGSTLLPDAYATGELEAIPGARTIGDESRITRVAARDPQSGTSSPELALGFRYGRLTARVLIRDLGDETPEVAEVEALAGALLVRIDRVLRDGGPGLSLQALRIELRAAWSPGTDAYLRLAGEDRPSAYESSEQLVARVAAYGDATDVFAGSTEIAATDSDYTLVFATTLYRFPDGDQASAWLRAAPNRLARSADVSELAADAEPAGLGDEAVALTLTRDPGGDGVEPYRAALVLVRAGAVVAEVRLERVYDAPSLATALDLAATQAACLDAPACLDAQPAPALPAHLDLSRGALALGANAPRA